MQTYSQTFTGAQTWTLNIPGKYFVLLGCLNPCNVRFFKGGKKLELGDITGLLAGLEVTLGELADFEAAFDRVEIDVTAADTVQVGIGNGQARYNRSQGNVAITNLTGSVTQTQKTVTSAAAELLAVKAGRRYLLIQNNDATGIVYLNLSGAATVGSGIKIAPGGSYVADASFCPSNAISAIGSIASNANIAVIEG